MLCISFIQHVAAYLADYAVEQFGLKLGENGWKNLLKEIVTRFAID